MIIIYDDVNSRQGRLKGDDRGSDAGARAGQAAGGELCRHEAHR